MKTIKHKFAPMTKNTARIIININGMEEFFQTTGSMEMKFVEYTIAAMLARTSMRSGKRVAKPLAEVPS